MRTERPSQTASLVAFYRAVANAGVTTTKGFSDPLARELLTWPWSALVRRVENKLARGENPDPKLAASADLLALGTQLIDFHLKRALSRGVRQVVVLGAGLDARAYRLPELRDAHVFEVDHPATQAFKKRAIGARTPLAKHHAYVSLDFEKCAVDVALASAGHATGEPTFWIWEGVVMYLTDEAVRTALHEIQKRSARGSDIVINYSLRIHKERLLPYLMRSLMLRLFSEPPIGERSTESMQGMVTQAGFRVLEDSNTSDWATRFGAGPQHPELANRYRCLLANLEDAA